MAKLTKAAFAKTAGKAVGALAGGPLSALLFALSELAAPSATGRDVGSREEAKWLEHEQKRKATEAKKEAAVVKRTDPKEARKRAAGRGVGMRYWKGQGKARRQYQARRLDGKKDENGLDSSQVALYYVKNKQFPQSRLLDNEDTKAHILSKVEGFIQADKLRMLHPRDRTMNEQLQMQ